MSSTTEITMQFSRALLPKPSGRAIVNIFVSPDSTSPKGIILLRGLVCHQMTTCAICRDCIYRARSVMLGVCSTHQETKFVTVLPITLISQ